MKKISGLIVAWLFVLGTGSQAWAADWCHWRGPWQTGVSPDTGLPDNVANNVLWRAPYGGRSTPLVLGNSLYLINYEADRVKVGNNFRRKPQRCGGKILTEMLHRSCPRNQQDIGRTLQ